MSTKPTGRPRGRPTKSFLLDPDRVVIAFAEGLIMGRGDSERAAYDLATAIFFGDEVSPEKKPRSRRPDSWVHTAFRLAVERGAPASIAGRAASLRQKWKRVRGQPELALWMNLIATSYAIAFSTLNYSEGESLIRRFCMEANEAQLAESLILPILNGRFS